MKARLYTIAILYLVLTLLAHVACAGAFHTAARQGDCQKVIQYLRSGGDVFAVADGVTLLAEYGVPNDFDWTALHFAAYCGHLDAAKALMVNQRNPRMSNWGIRRKLVNLRSHCGFTPLQLAALGGHLPIVKLLYSDTRKSKMAKNICGPQTYGKLKGTTAMHCAAWGGHIEIIEFLRWSYGTRTWRYRGRDGYGRTLMHYAAEQGHEETVLFLKKKEWKEAGYPWSSMVGAKDEHGMTPKALALQAGYDDVAEMLGTFWLWTFRMGINAVVFLGVCVLFLGGAKISLDRKEREQRQAQEWNALSSEQQRRIQEAGHRARMAAAREAQRQELRFRDPRSGF